MDGQNQTGVGLIKELGIKLCPSCSYVASLYEWRKHVVFICPRCGCIDPFYDGVEMLNIDDVSFQTNEQKTVVTAMMAKGYELSHVGRSKVNYMPTFVLVKGRNTIEINTLGYDEYTRP